MTGERDNYFFPIKKKVINRIKNLNMKAKRKTFSISVKAYAARCKCKRLPNYFNYDKEEEYDVFTQRIDSNTLPKTRYPFQ